TSTRDGTVSALQSAGVALGCASRMQYPPPQQQQPYGPPNQQPYGPQPYGQLPMGYGPPVDTSDAGTSVLIWGALGLALCQLCAPVAWVKGNAYVQTCAAMGV